MMEEVVGLNRRIIIRSGWDFSLLGKLAWEVISGDVLHQWVPFAAFSFVFGSLSWDSDSDSSGEVSDALIPDELVELGVNSDISSLHHLCDQLLHFVDGSRGFLFELNSMGQFMDVDSSIDGGFAEPFSFLFLSHYHKIIIN